MNSAPGTGTVSRAVHLIALIADADGPLTVTQVAHELEVPASTSHRLLNLLRSEDFVAVAAPGLYGPGPKLFRVASRLLQRLSPSAAAKPAIEALAAKYNETVLFGLYVPKEQCLAFLGRADGSQKLTYQVEMDRPISVLWGASGKAVLAYLPEAVVRSIYDENQKSPTGKKSADLVELMDELALIRTRGWAESDGEKLPGAHGIAAPVFGASGVIGSICLTSPRDRLSHVQVETLGSDVAEVAADLSRSLGWAS